LKSLKTKWSPGMFEGKAVRTSYNLPITIQPN
jgi:protein TonB